MKQTLVFLLFVVLTVYSSALPFGRSSDDPLEQRVDSKVKFYLYSKANPYTPQELFVYNETSVLSSNYDRTVHTKILIHGWGGSYLASPNKSLREAYLSQQNCNIISVDYNAYAKLDYVTARARAPSVGEAVAQFVDFMHDSFGLSLNMLVVIGHSLGAHVAGFCGKSVKRGQLAAIVGLDPAFPLYSYNKPQTRLASTDARFVETLQTNGNVKGFLKPIGTASFYPNWGRLQPGCGNDLDGTCSHGRSVTLYAEAVRNFSFAPINQCDNFTNISEKSGCTSLQSNVQMGDPLLIRRVEGIFYLTTNAQAPYGHVSESTNE